MARQPVTFQRIRSVLTLVVGHVTDDFDSEDFVRTPEHLVDRLPELTGRDLEADGPPRIGLAGEVFRDRHLAAVSE
jgi:hypothetical protein